MLKTIIESIIPDNIKNIPLVRKCTDVFVEELEKNSLISERISNLYAVDRISFLQEDKYGNVEEIKDSDFLIECKNNLKNGLFQVYLNVLYNLAKSIQSNPLVKEAVELRRYQDTLIKKNIYDILTSEYLGAFKYFQQNSGTKKAIKYIYQFAKYIETGHIFNDLEIDDNNGLFFLDYEGSLHKYFFSEFNQPMSHPCGWCFNYSTILSEELIDEWEFENEDELFFDYRISLYDSSDYLRNDFHNAFRLVGNSYRFTPGIDETIQSVSNYSDDNYKSYDITIPLNIQHGNMVHIKCSDEYGHSYVMTMNKTLKELKVNTHGWYGDTLLVLIKNIELNYFIKVNILNKIFNNLIIKSFNIKNNNIHIKGNSNSNISYNFTFKTTNISNNVNVTSGQFEFDIDISSLGDIDTYYTLTISNGEDTVTINSDLDRNILGIPEYKSVNIMTPVLTDYTPQSQSGKTIKKLVNSGLTLVNEGYALEPIDSEDCYVSNSTKYTKDDFSCNVIANGSVLIFDNSKNEGSYTDGKYLTAYETLDNYDKERGMVGYMLLFRS